MIKNSLGHSITGSYIRIRQRIGTTTGHAKDGQIGAMIVSMPTVHMTYHEVSNDFEAVLQNIRSGADVIVEQDHQPVALIRAPNRSGRSISECIASAKASGSKVTLDGGFAQDVEEGIKSRQEPWNPPAWE